MRRFAILLGFVFVVAACEGPAGPQGPTGPQGPAGPSGPQGPPGTGSGGRVTILAQPDSTGLAAVQFPASVNLPAEDPPGLLCYYTSEDSNGTWYPMNDGYWEEESPWCALIFVGDNRWGAAGVNLSPDWIAAFVAIY